MDGFVIKETRLRGLYLTARATVCHPIFCLQSFTGNLPPADCRDALRAFCAVPAQKRSRRLIDKPDEA
jgi:hypothetical protein